MKSIIDHLNEAYESPVTEGSLGRNEYHPVEDFSKNKIIKAQRLNGEDTVEVIIDNENPQPGNSGYHLHINPEEWMYGNVDFEDDEDSNVVPKQYIFHTTKKMNGQEILISVVGDEYMDYVPECSFVSDGPITLDFSGLGYEWCEFTGPITVKDGDNRGKNKFNKGAKEF